MKNKLNTINLNTDNSVVIGSGILQVMGIRNSGDIDLVVDEDTFKELEVSGKFNSSAKHNHKILENEVFEIGMCWEVLDRKYKYKNLLSESVILDGVRYITLDFLLKVKKSWVGNGSARPKDLNDIKLIENYMEQLS